MATQPARRPRPIRKALGVSKRREMDTWEASNRREARSNRSGGGRYAGNDSVVRQTCSRMIVGDVGQRADGDSSPSRHEFHRNSNPPARSRMAHCTHLFSTALQLSTHPQFFEGCYSEFLACSNILFLYRRPKTTKVLPRTRARLLQEVAL